MQENHRQYYPHKKKKKNQSFLSPSQIWFFKCCHPCSHSEMCHALLGCWKALAVWTRPVLGFQQPNISTPHEIGSIEDTFFKETIWQLDNKYNLSGWRTRESHFLARQHVFIWNIHWQQSHPLFQVRASDYQQERETSECQLNYEFTKPYT